MNAREDLFGHGMREILESKVGVFPLFVYCFNDILNKRLLLGLESKGLLNRNHGSSEGIGENPPPRRIGAYLGGLSRKRSTVEKVDVLFISRYRPVAVNGVEEQTTDYLFNPVINEVYRSPTRLKMALISVGSQGKCYTDERVDSFSLPEFLSFGLILKSIFRSFLLYLKYRKTVRRLSNTQKRIFGGFFSPANLLFYHLLDFCLGMAIQNFSPKVIVANDDVLRFKALIDLGFKLIILQSALVAEQSEERLALLFSSFLEDRLLSDYFCVSGSQSESLKQRFLKDTKKIVVTGQPRFDDLARADGLFNRNEIRRKFGLTADRKTLLWATETHALSLGENMENISVVYHAAKTLENIQLVIKLHPDEDQEAPLYKQDHSYAPVIAKGNQNLYELLYVCDVMITKSSTSAIEAAILNKPIIILNLSEKPDFMPYVEEGVAIGVHKREDLIPALENALYNGKVREELARKREKFVYEYAYKRDGKASERVANLILQVIKESGRNKNG